MDRRLLPEFVDKERFCNHYLTTLERLCEKFIVAAKKDAVELDFSRQLYLRNGAVVNRDDREGDGSDEDDEKSGGIVIDIVPKTQWISTLPDRLEDLPTDKNSSNEDSKDMIVALNSMTSKKQLYPALFLTITNCKPSLQHGYDSCRVFTIFQVVSSSPLEKLREEILLELAPDQRQENCITRTFTQHLSQPVAIVSPLLPPLPALETRTHTPPSHSGRKSSTLSGRETVALLSPWSTGKLRRRPSCQLPLRRGSSVRQSLFMPPVAIGLLPMRLFVHQRSQSLDSLHEGETSSQMSPVTASEASSLHTQTSLFSTEHLSSRPLAIEGMSSLTAPQAFPLHQQPSLVSTECSSSKLLAATVVSPITASQASTVQKETSLVSTEQLSSKPSATTALTMSPITASQAFPSHVVSAVVSRKSPLSYRQAVKRPLCSPGTPAKKRTRLDFYQPVSMSDILKEEPLLCLSPGKYSGANRQQRRPVDDETV